MPLFEGRLQVRFHRVGIGDIGLHSQGRNTVFLDLLLDPVQTLGAASEQADRCPRAGEGARGRATHAG